MEKNLWTETVPWIDAPDLDIATAFKDCGDLQEKLLEWRERGIVVFQDVIPPNLIDALVHDVEYLLKHYRDFDLLTEVNALIKPINQFEYSEISTSKVKYNSIHSISGAAILLSLNKVISRFLQKIFNGPSCVMQSLTFYKGSQQPIHIDYPYVRTQTKLGHLAASWIPLEDIHPDSGPLAYYPGSHKVEVSGFFDWGNRSILMEKDSDKTPQEFAEYLSGRVKKFNIKPEIFVPKKGDVLIWHGNLMHEGSLIKNDLLTRKSYVTHYTSLEAYPEDYKINNSEINDGAVYQNGSYCFEYPWVREARKLPSWSLVPSIDRI